MKSEEFSISSPFGYMHAKKWTPENPLSELPLILLHDSLGSVALWQNFPKLLATHLCRCVVAYDRLGFGKSDARTGLLLLDFIEEEAVKFFPVIKEKLCPTRYVLLGHSVGGAMAINIAARDVDCAAVITMASQAFVEDLTVVGIKNAMKAFEKPEQMKRLEKWHGKKAEWVLNAWTDTWLSPDFSSWSLENCIEKVVCPVLAIHGDKDEFGSTAFPEFIAGKAGGTSEMVILQDCGHLPHREKPKEVINAVKKILMETNDT